MTPEPPAPAAGSAVVAWVSLGANLGNRTAALAALRAALVGGPVHLEAASRELLTRAVGVSRQPDFHNQVVRLRSDVPLPPAEWLARCDRAQRAAGRRPTYRWGPRRADADILLLGERGELRADQAGVCVPHPELGNRPFLCALLAELDPGLRHPDGWLLSGSAGIFLSSPRCAQTGGSLPRPSAPRR
ncbi:MAG: 2-amino-4-hydroxy-6-hydroxymethyldihydropteridine diphosphokinase [Chloroflexota bacterium]|nr:2-amino-4-hydroxy-6-hydroxymethyldihydropteridine diphosphokinase [Chloroflexota bacterium]